MRPTTARVALVALVAGGAIAAAVAVRTGPDDVVALADRSDRDATGSVEVPPELPVLAASAPAVEAAGWLNTDPLTAEDLAGRVVLYEFWTFGCVNCRNVLPHVRAWHERYAEEGLVVLSVHTPEFPYERDPEAVARFVEEEAIRYPVALDPDKRTWRAFENRYWPAFYLHDADGRRRLVHFGEGAYEETEDAIRALLDVPAEAPRAEVVE